MNCDGGRDRSIEILVGRILVKVFRVQFSEVVRAVTIAAVVTEVTVVTEVIIEFSPSLLALTKNSSI